MLRHDLRHGLVVIVAGGPALTAAEAADGDGGQRPLIIAHGEHTAEGQHPVLVGAGEHRPPARHRLTEVGELIGLDAVRGGGIIHADQEVDVLPSLRQPQGLVDEAELPLPAAEVPGHRLLRDAVVHRVQGRAVRPQGVGGRDALHRQGVPAEGRAGGHAVGAQGLVAREVPAVIAHRGGKAHDGVQQVHLVLPVREEVQNGGEEGLLRQNRAVPQRHIRPGEAPGVHEPSGEELVQGQNVAVAARRLPVLEPGVEPRPVAVGRAVGVGVLPVQPGAVEVLLRHREPVAQGLRQVGHPVGVHRPVVQGDVADLRAGVLPLRQPLRLRRGGAAGGEQQTEPQDQGGKSFSHSVSFLKNGRSRCPARSVFLTGRSCPGSVRR